MTHTTKEASVYMAAAAAFLFALAPALPDTAIGSPRAICIAAAGGLTAAAIILRGRN